jgi:hypothetical protein
MYQTLFMLRPSAALVVDAAGRAPHDSQDRRDEESTGARLSETGDFNHEPCLNCGEVTPGRYCRTCGQRKGEVRVSMRRLIADVLEDQLSINSALPRTLGALLFRPGRLTAEYARGRIASYIAPFRLYLVASLVFFLTASIASRIGIVSIGSSAARSEAAADSIAEAQGATSGDTVAPVDTAGGGIAADSTAPTRDEGPTVRVSARDDRNMIGINISNEDLQRDSIDWRRAINTRIPALDSALVRRVERLRGSSPDQVVREIVGGMIESAPTVMFLLLPVFALLLKLLYFRSSRFYVEHFVFALHYHAFAFVLYTVIIVVPEVLRPELLLIWLYLYLPIAMKRVYEQGWVRTSLKWIALSSVYSVFIAIGVLATALVAFLSA